MKLLLAGIFSAAALLSAAPAGADPSSGCSGLNDPRLCNPSKVYYCPDTGQFGSVAARRAPPPLQVTGRCCT
jgi:hypothetical protein